MHGRIRQRIEDFYVEEIPGDIKVDPNGKYAIFWLEKMNWDTMRAIMRLAKAFGVSKKRFGIAGTKDKRAITRQLVSVWDVPKEKIESVKLKDMKLEYFCNSNERITLGMLHGNKFVITIRDVPESEDEIARELEVVKKDLERGIPNIFGPQRFGEVRPITAEVGKAMLRGNFEGAVKTYLTKVFPLEPEDAKRARNFLAEHWGDFAGALELFPKRLHWERAMLEYLKIHPHDFAGALRRIPKRLRKMFINAVQSEVWNNALLEAFENYGVIESNLPLPGYDTVLDEKDPLQKVLTEKLEEAGIKLSDFKVHSMPELACTGSQRATILKVNDFKVEEIKDDELNTGKRKVKVSFSLPPGSYASVVLDYFLKPSAPRENE